jgi:hypothetical protein
MIKSQVWLKWLFWLSIACLVVVLFEKFRLLSLGRGCRSKTPRCIVPFGERTLMRGIPLRVDPQHASSYRRLWSPPVGTDMPVSERT